jgi:peptidoglycan/LPS O-acetylase OafA/YrhL
VACDVLRGTFRFADFYWRRARRLLPAAYAMIAVCVLFAPFLLTDFEMGDFFKQVFGALTFTANVVRCPRNQQREELESSG